MTNMVSTLLQLPQLHGKISMAQMYDTYVDLKYSKFQINIKI